MPREDTQFKPGNPGKPKGAKHRTTAEFKEMLHQFLTGDLEKAIEALNMQHGHKYIDSYVKLAKFVLPTLNKNENENTNTGEVKISVEYVSTDKEQKQLEQPVTLQLEKPQEQLEKETLELPF